MRRLLIREKSSIVIVQFCFGDPEIVGSNLDRVTLEIDWLSKERRESRRKKSLVKGKTLITSDSVFACSIRCQMF